LNKTNSNIIIIHFLFQVFILILQIKYLCHIHWIYIVILVDSLDWEKKPYMKYSHLSILSLEIL